METKIHLIKYIEPHPIATSTPDRVYEIVEMQNAVVVYVNKQAKLEYGAGTQIEVSVGDRLSKQQAIQIADTHQTTLIAVAYPEQDAPRMLNG